MNATFVGGVNISSLAIPFVAHVKRQLFLPVGNINFRFSKGRKKGIPCIAYGVMTDPDGRPVAVSTYRHQWHPKIA